MARGRVHTPSPPVACIKEEGPVGRPPGREGCESGMRARERQGGRATADGGWRGGESLVAAQRVCSALARPRVPGRTALTAHEAANTARAVVRAFRRSCVQACLFHHARLTCSRERGGMGRHKHRARGGGGRNQYTCREARWHVSCARLRMGGMRGQVPRWVCCTRRSVRGQEDFWIHGELDAVYRHPRMTPHGAAWLWTAGRAQTAPVVWCARVAARPAESESAGGRKRGAHPARRPAPTVGYRCICRECSPGLHNHVAKEAFCCAARWNFLEDGGTRPRARAMTCRRRGPRRFFLLV